MDTRLTARLASGVMHGQIVASTQKLRRGQVWCRKCGHTKRVGSAKALRNGWPEHCGETMTIDAPSERV